MKKLQLKYFPIRLNASRTGRGGFDAANLTFEPSRDGLSARWRELDGDGEVNVEEVSSILYQVAGHHPTAGYVITEPFWHPFVSDVLIRDGVMRRLDGGTLTIPVDLSEYDGLALKPPFVIHQFDATS